MVASISAVLPAYNEEAIIADTARAMAAVLRDLVDDYEVIVVNDGSRDATAVCVKRVAAELPTVRLVSHAENRGYGAALATGFSAATKDWIFLTDGDKQFDAREIAGFIPEMQGADLVVGVRQPRRDPLLRRLNGWGWNRLVRLSVRAGGARRGLRVQAVPARGLGVDPGRVGRGDIQRRVLDQGPPRRLPAAGAPRHAFAAHGGAGDGGAARRDPARLPRSLPPAAQPAAAHEAGRGPGRLWARAACGAWAGVALRRGAAGRRAIRSRRGALA